MRFSLAILTLLFSIGAAKLSAQVIGGCPPGGTGGGAPTCEQACVVCDFTMFADQTGPNITPTLTIDNCGFGQGPIVLENPSWYAFIAGSSFVRFDIKPLQCSGTDGLEAAIVYGCTQPYKALNCTPLQGGPFGDGFIVAFNLDIGSLYYLVIDGVNSNDCKYMIDVTQGSTYTELGQLDSIQGLKEVCPKALVQYSIPKVTNALTYTWVSPPGSKINGGSNVKILSSTNDNATNISVEFGNLGGTVCVTASNVCDTPKTTCIPIINKALPVTQLDDRSICFEELPFFWEEEPFNFISAPGTYTFTSVPYVSYLGCDSMVRQKITALPRKFKNLPLTYLCEPNCLKVGDFEYCDTGTYHETLSADNGCDSTVNFSVIKIPIHAGIAKPDTITCRNPTVTLSIDSLTTTGGAVFYKWINLQGQTISMSSTAAVSSAGPFFLIVTNSAGGKSCPDTAEVTVPVNNTPPVSNAGPNRVLNCETPQIVLQGSGSTGSQYTYLWLALNGGNIVSGSTTLTPTINAPGTYRLRVTNEINGCTATDNTIVTAQILPPSATATGGTFSCAVPTVQIGATTNATSPTFLWGGPNGFTSNLQNPVANTAGTYTVTITDGGTGCTNTALATVVANTTPPGATATGGTLTCVVNSVTINASTAATNPQFAWAGPGGFSSSLPNPSAGATGVYTVTVTGENGCTSTATTTVGLDNTAPGAALAVAANLNCNNATVNITATSNGPAASLQHLWTLPDATTTSTGALPVLAAATPGAYNVVITNTENGCTSSATASVTQSPAVTASVDSVENALCFGQQNGGATAAAGGGNGTFSYLWNNSQATAALTNVGAGVYTVTVTDAENCTATATASITEPTELAATASATPQMANGSADGTATVNPVGGTVSYTYDWSNDSTTATITGLLPGIYTVTVTDANGCTAVSIATVNAYNCTIQSAVQASDATCFEANDGQATVTTLNGVAPFTYQWSTGESTVSIGNLKPGIYTVLVTDAAQCPEAHAFTISEPSLVNANATATPMSGPNTSDGTATASPTGGTTPYTYLWSNDSTTATITGLAAGLYTVTVADEHGCTAVQTVEVLPGNCGLIANFIVNEVLCTGQSNGQATILLTGGNGPFTYLWSSGGTLETETGLAAGTYTVTVTDVNNCDIEESVAVGEPPVLTLALDSVVNTACEDLPDGSATVTPGGGTPPLDITWSNGQTGPTATALVAGTYTATVEDLNGCQTSLDVVVAAVDIEAPDVAEDTATAPLGTAGTVAMSVQVLGLTITDNCGVNEISFEPKSFNCAQLGDHPVEVTVSDDAGNVTVKTITVTVVDQLAPTLVCPASIVRCHDNDVVEYDAPVATDNCLGNGGMFNLVSGLPSGSTFPQGTTTTTYTYTDADGNVGSCTFEVTVLSPITIQFDDTIPDIGNQMQGRILITVNGSLSPYIFAWHPEGDTTTVVGTSEDLIGVGMGNYYVEIIDDNGCTAVSDVYHVSNLVGIHEPDWASKLLIVPNPTSGRLSVIFPEDLDQDVRLAVFDLTGRLVEQMAALKPQRVDFDLSTLPDGLYTILVNINREVIARKIVVSKK